MRLDWIILGDVLKWRRLERATAREEVGERGKGYPWGEPLG